MSTTSNHNIAVSPKAGPVVLPLRMPWNFNQMWRFILNIRKNCSENFGQSWFYAYSYVLQSHSIKMGRNFVFISTCHNYDEILRKDMKNIKNSFISYDYKSSYIKAMKLHSDFADNLFLICSSDFLGKWNRYFSRVNFDPWCPFENYSTWNASVFLDSEGKRTSPFNLCQSLSSSQDLRLWAW